jgi:hypothetical protein
MSKTGLAQVFLPPFVLKQKVEPKIQGRRNAPLPVRPAHNRDSALDVAVIVLAVLF